MRYLSILALCVALCVGCSTVETLPPVTPDTVCICADGHNDACLVCSPKHSHEDGEEHSHEE